MGEFTRCLLLLFYLYFFSSSKVNHATEVSYDVIVTSYDSWGSPSMQGTLPVKVQSLVWICDVRQTSLYCEVERFASRKLLVPKNPNITGIRRSNIAKTR